MSKEKRKWPLWKKCLVAVFILAVAGSFFPDKNDQATKSEAGDIKIVIGNDTKKSEQSKDDIAKIPIDELVGDLHRKDGNAWVNAKLENKYATCLDFISTKTKQINKQEAFNVVECIDEVFKKGNLSQAVADVGAMCMTLLKIGQ